MVIAHHLMWTLYGWWLPNDPRGSTSTTIQSNPLRDLGELHQGRKRLQPTTKIIRTFYQSAADKLVFPLLSFDRTDFPIVAAALGQAIAHHQYTCYAAAVMPDHIHLLIRKHKHPAEAMIDNLQSHSRSSLINATLRRPEHPTWTQGGWKVFQDTPQDITRTIRYIEENPTKRGWPIQKWNWVEPYNGWPFHKSHPKKTNPVGPT